MLPVSRSSVYCAELTHLRLPVGGDQLTRVRLQGAKSLRAGCHTAAERLEILYPVVMELFHTVMDFLEKMTKKFMKKNGRDIGALQNLKIIIQRSSVNGNVKSRYAAHEDFSMLVGRSYFLEYALSYFSMNSLDDIPHKHIPENIKNCHQAKKESIFQSSFKDLATEILGKCKFEQPSKSIFVNGAEASIPLAADKIVLNLNSSGGIVQVPLDVKSLANPLLLKLPNGTSINIKSKGDDDLLNYAKQYLHYFSILLCIKDAIREGNIFVINIALKMMLPCFFAHSELSKYFVECIHFILLTEHLLEPKLALQVRVSSLVNPNGGPGANKPADMEKENQVRDLKKLIKGLGANKTENSIINLSKAAPIVDSITENFDVQITCKTLNTCHKSRPDIPDLLTLLGHIHQLQPFQYTEGRTLNSFKFFKASVYDELYDKKDRFMKSIDSVVWRSKMNFQVQLEDESGSSDEEQ